MKSNLLKHINEFEEEFIKESIPSGKEFRKIGFYLIRDFVFPLQLIRNLKKVPSIRKYLELDIRRWIIFFIISLSQKKINKKNLFDLLGIVLAWKFLPKKTLTIRANFIYYRGSDITLIYPEISPPQVLKVKIRKSNFSELDNLLIANKIKHKNVFSPQIIQSYQDLETEWFSQEMIFAKDLGTIPRFLKRKILFQVFEFMVEFYFYHGISLHSPNLEQYLDDKRSISVMEKSPKWQNINEYIHYLKNQNKFLFKTTIHADLYTKNILVNKNREIWIIDWGNTSKNYLVHDFKSLDFDKQGIFELIFQKGNFKRSEIFSLNDQVFIEDFIDLHALIKKSIKKNNIDKDKKRINHRLNRMSKIIDFSKSKDFENTHSDF